MKTTRSLLTPLFLAGAFAMSLASAGCVVDTGPDDGYGGGGSCLPNLFIDYELENAAGAPVTCAGAGAVTVQATVDGTMFPVSCAPGSSFGTIEVPLQGLGIYNASVNVFDAKGNALAAAQTSQFNITSCGDTETQSPAILVVVPAAASSTTSTAAP